MAKSISQKATTEIRKLIDDACGTAHACLPCASVAVVCKGDDVPSLMHSSVMIENSPNIFEDEENAAGSTLHSGAGHDNIYWLDSCTKQVTGIACMQLVEQGKLKLDDCDQVEKICPELAAVKVLQGDGSLVDKKSRITLRMLLTHTAGFGYSFLNEGLQIYTRQKFPEGPEYDEFSGRIVDFQQPLMNQPGERFEYVINIDWAGILVERSTGLKLNDHMQRFILSPLDIDKVSMFPSSHMKDRLAGMWQRDSTGRLCRRDYPVNARLCNGSPSDTFRLFGDIRQFSSMALHRFRSKMPTSSYIDIIPRKFSECYSMMARRLRQVGQFSLPRQ